MLVLSRCVGQTIVIGDSIRIKVMGNAKGIVQIGISAPPEVRVDREEIHVRRQRDRLAAEKGADL